MKPIKERKVLEAAANCCPDCGTRYMVAESRRGDGAPIMVYRRRQCVPCDYHIWTVEIPFAGDVPANIKNYMHTRKIA